MPDAARLWAMTPREIGWTLNAFSAACRRENERTDLLAWLIGRYGMFALHAPRRYPKQPDAVRRPEPVMTDDQMKQVFVNLAGRDFE